MSTRSVFALAATVSAALALGACSSARLGGGFGGPIRSAQAMPAPLPEPDPVEAVPSGPVMSEPLPPLAGQTAPGDIMAPGATDIAALPPGAPTLAPAPTPTPAPSGRSSLVGGWTARDAAGATCRVNLSSSPALDLYRASSSGCSNADLSRVTAWDYRDGEVYLYQPGGAVAARLRTGGGGLSGVLAKSGAPLSLAR
jgi:hypothetical protein